MIVLDEQLFREIPSSLRSVLRHPEFRTKAQRMGKIIRVVDQEMRFYTFNDRQVQTR